MVALVNGNLCQHKHSCEVNIYQLQDGTVDCSKVACVSGVRFASPTVGYLYGPALLMTSDSGRTWRAQPGLQVETLTIVGSQVYRVAYDHGGCPGPWRRT